MTAVASSAMPVAEVVGQPVDDLPFMLVDRAKRTPRIVELVLAPLGRPLSHAAGQYVLLGDVDGRVPPRSYSVANLPRADGQLSLLVTEVPGGETSRWAHRLKPGATVSISGPYGTFVDDPAWRGPILHLAAGSGLAPILAIVESQLPRDDVPEVAIVFSARTPADLYMLGRLRYWQRTHPRFRFIPTLTRPAPAALQHGRIPAILPTLVGDLSAHAVFVAGNDGFVDACVAAARSCGAPPQRIRTESFFSEPKSWLGRSAEEAVGQQR